MIRPAQLRMARAALGWSLKELAGKAKIHLNTVSRCEAGHEALTGTMQRIEDVFRNEGIVFVENESSIGVTMVLDNVRHPAGLPRKKSKTKPKSSRKRMA
jgi:predicted transcriptional regulator